MVMNGKIEFRFMAGKQRETVRLSQRNYFFQNISAHKAIVWYRYEQISNKIVSSRFSRHLFYNSLICIDLGRELRALRNLLPE